MTTILTLYNSYFLEQNFLYSRADFSLVTPDTFNNIKTEKLKPVFFAANGFLPIQNRRILLTENSEYFMKSLLLYFLLNGNREIIYPSLANDGLLRNETVNCFFTLANINGLNRFIKVVPYDFVNRKDCIIFDVINGFIFDFIIKNNTKYDYFRNYFPAYINSFLSYYTEIKNQQGQPTYYWDYNRTRYCSNKLLNASSITVSPYIPYTIYIQTPSGNIPYNPLLNVFNTDGQPPYDIHKRVFIYYSEAISNSISVKSLFVNCEIKKSECENLIKNIETFFYGFLLLIGIKFGFCHNDLHFGNLLFNLSTNKIILLDLGRSAFCYYIYEQNEELINKQLIYEINKLNLNYHSYYSIDCSTISTYADLFRHSNTRLLFENRNFLTNFKVLDDNGKVVYNYYPLCVFDIIAYSCNIYVYMLHYLYIKANKNFDNKDFNDFQKHFGYLLEIDNLKNLLENNKLLKFNFTYKIKNNSYSDQNNLENILKTYEDIITSYISVIDNKDPYNDFKNIFKIILDGLLLCALLYLKFRKNGISKSNSKSNMLYCNFISLLNIDNKKIFCLYLKEIYKDQPELFDKYSHPLKFILTNNPNIEIYIFDENYIGGRSPSKSRNTKSLAISSRNTKSLAISSRNTKSLAISSRNTRSLAISSKQTLINEKILDELNDTYENYLDFYKYKNEI